MAIHCAKSIKGRPLRKTSLTYIQLYIQNSAFDEFNSIFSKKHYNNTVLNWIKHVQQWTPSERVLRATTLKETSESVHRFFWRFKTCIVPGTTDKDKKPYKPPFFKIDWRKIDTGKFASVGASMTNTTSILGVRESVLIPQRSPRMSPTRISGVSTAST